MIQPKTRRYLLAAWLLLACGAAAQAGPPGSRPLVAVSAQGNTHLAGKFGGAMVSAEIAGHSLPADQWRSEKQPGNVRCTGSRNPCMLVDSLRLRVNGHAIEVPRSILVALSDVDRAGLSAAGAGQYKLVLECGDASEGYTAIIVFDGKRVKQRDVIDGEAGKLAERTIYSDLSHAFQD